MTKISFYCPNTKDPSIIAYGDIKNKRTFKITYKKSTYFAWKKEGKKYRLYFKGSSFKNAQEACFLTLNNK